MNIKTNLITLSILIGALLSANTTFTRWGGGGAVAGGIIAGSLIGASIASSNARARDREAYYQDQAARDREARYREEDARRRERAAERRHEKEMAALRGPQNKKNVQPMNMDDDYANE